MAYIGIDPNVGDITFQRFTGDGSTTAFTLAQSVASGEAIIVSVGNVIQEPGASASYTAYGTTLTFSEAPANTDDIVVRYFGRAIDQPLSYAMQLFKFVATASQTVFTGADNAGAILAFSGNDVDVYLNGVHLDTADYTPSNGDTITLASGAALNDELVIRAFRAFTVTDTVSKASGGTFGGGVTVNGDLTVDTNTLYVDSTNNRVGVGNAAPTTALDVTGDITVSGGVYLGGTVSANALDDYEEGTFTPTLYHSSTNNSTFSSANGEYTKIGNTVTCQLRVDGGNSGTAGSFLEIGGLPFAVSQAQGNMGIGIWGSNPSQQVGNIHGFNPPRVFKGGQDITTQMTFFTAMLVYKTS